MSSIGLTSQPSRLALPALVAGATAIGASPIFVRLSEIGPIATAFHRMLWALPLLWLWMRLERHSGAVAAIRRRDLPGLLLCGLFFVGDLAFWHLSILYTTVANATLFANFSAIVVTAGAWLLFGERITGGFLLGLGLALGGAALLVGASFDLGERYVLGDLLGIVTALFFAGYMLVVVSLRGRLPASTIMFWSSLVTCLGLLPIALVVGESLVPATGAGLAVLVALAWISQAAGQGLIAYSLGHLPAAFSSLVILIEPLAAAALGWVLLGEMLAPLQMAGGAAVLAGILLARRASGTAA